MMKTARILAIAATLLLAAATCAAADGEEAPVLVHLAEPTAAAAEPVAPAVTTVLTLSTQARKNGAGRSFWMWNVAAHLSTVLDVESTQMAMGNGAHEGNSFLYGSHPSRLRMYATNAPIDLGISYLSYRMKKHACTTGSCGAWRVPLAVLTVTHTAAGLANLVRFH